VLNLTRAEDPSVVGAQWNAALILRASHRTLLGAGEKLSVGIWPRVTGVGMAEDRIGLAEFLTELQAELSEAQTRAAAPPGGVTAEQEPVQRLTLRVSKLNLRGPLGAAPSFRAGHVPAPPAQHHIICACLRR